MKKMNPTLLGFIIALLICIVSLIVYFQFIERESYQLIDNPSKATITVAIDEQEYIIPANQQLKIDLPQGQHLMQVRSEVDSLQLPEVSFEVTRLRGVINPTQSVYFSFGMPYGPTVNKDSIFTKLKTTYQGKTYAGDIEVDSAFYIDNFYYNLDEKFPGLTLKSENKQLRRKIFRLGDFKQFYFENYE